MELCYGWRLGLPRAQVPWLPEGMGQCSHLGPVWKPNWACLSPAAHSGQGGGIPEAPSRAGYQHLWCLGTPESFSGLMGEWAGWMLSDAGWAGLLKALGLEGGGGVCPHPSG